MAGLVVVLYDPAAGGEAAGIAISVAGVACCALYTIAARAWLGASDSTVAVVLGQELYALGFAAALVVVVGVSGGPVLPSAVSLATIASAVGSGLLYYGVAYWLYLTALRTLAASVAATSFYLIPVFGLAAAAAFGERLAPVQWIGAAVVIAALLGIAAGARAMPRSATEASPRVAS